MIARNLLSAPSLLRWGFLLAAVAAGPAWAKEVRPDAQKLLAQIDQRSRGVGDVRVVAHLVQKEKNRKDFVREMMIYRRPTQNRLIMLFSLPKSEAGKGYLRQERNMWSFDPSVGRWERRTARDRIAGTNSRSSDLDELRLAEQYEATYDGEEALGGFKTHRLVLKSRSEDDAPYPVVKLWVNAEDLNMLKREDYALSGRKMRTSYFTGWHTNPAPARKEGIWSPRQIRILDDIDQSTETIIIFRQTEYQTLEDSVYTKAWMEKQSR